MARKGNQNGVDRHSSKHKKKGSDSRSVPDMKEREKVNQIKGFPGEVLQNGNLNFTNTTSNYGGDGNNAEQISGNFGSNEKQGVDAKQIPDQCVCSGSSSGECIEDLCSSDLSSAREVNGTLPDTHRDPNHSKNNLGCSLRGLCLKILMEGVNFSNNTAVKSLRLSTMSMLRRASAWLEKQRPYFISLTTSIMSVRDYARVKFDQACPIVLKWLFQLGSIILVLSMVWLDCCLRGIDSFLHMGTTSFFTVVWCSILSIIAMAGMFKFLMILAIAVCVGLSIGFIVGILVLAMSGTIYLWVYGSFWTTSLIIFLGGLAFMVKHERIALSITTLYAVYCAWIYVGWLGVLLSLNISFISNDALIYFLKNNINQQRPGRVPEQTAGTGPGLSSDHGPRVPSTGGTDSEVTSEDEVIRLLNCKDHYSALGLSLYEDIDASLIKREYRKKAMLVHPDKNMGNEKAAEAFKKLQNAYEVLLDSLKRKEYDDELRREELLNYFRRFQGPSHKNGGHSMFASGSDGEDLVGYSRRIVCKKCRNFHAWVHTTKTKSQARWCQDCKDFHPAKDGDGWVEQCSQPLLFGLMQKVDAPCAYVCADSRIYDATEWYICQGMRCVANTHKPSFHVNTSMTSSSKQSTGKGRGMPTSNMTEEEFMEWLQNAVQAGDFSSTNNNPSPSGSNTKRKKGKKW